MRRLILDGLCASGAGPLSYSKLTATSIRRWRDSKSDRPDAANSLIKALRQLFAFATEYRPAARNPAKDVRYLKGNSEGFHSWTEDEIGRFEAHHSVGSTARLALALLLYTGQCRSGCGLVWEAASAWRLAAFHTAKEPKHQTGHADNPDASGTSSHHRCDPVRWSDVLDVRTRPTVHREWLRVRKWCDDVGIPSECSAHGLRKAAACRLAEAGATELEIRAITGHQTSREVSRYTKAANQKLMAKSAMEKLTGNKIVPLKRTGVSYRKNRKEDQNVKRWNGAQGRNRTTDTVIFSHVLYQLSYLGGWRRRGAARAYKRPRRALSSVRAGSGFRGV